MRVTIDRATALIVVDVQNDFCPGGALRVPEGDRVVPVLNSYIRKFQRAGAPIFFTRDWHPPNHLSFREQGGIWPPHCIQNTPGAQFHPKLIIPSNAPIISKADAPDKEAYSGFEGTDLQQRLRKLGVTHVLVGGLATDYCVKNTALDALKAGFEVVMLEDASRGVDVKAGDSARAIEDLLRAGAKRTTLPEVD